MNSSPFPHRKHQAFLATALLGVALATQPARAGHPVVEKFDAYDPQQILSVENGSFEKAASNGQMVLRWHVNAGESSELALRREHPLFNRLRYYDRLQFDFRIASGDIDSVEVRALGHVSGIRQYKVHQWNVACHTTQPGLWSSRELDLARPNWFPWDNPDGEGGQGFFMFGAVALEPDTVIELRNVRLVRSVIYVKPFYEMPITWPVKTENPDGGITYTTAFQVLNTANKPITITAQVQSRHQRFKVALDQPAAEVKSSKTARFVLTATLSKEDIAATPELYEEPFRVSFAAAHEPDAASFCEGCLVRPLSKTIRRQVFVPEADLKVIREKIQAGDAEMKRLVGYDQVVKRADDFLAIRLDHVPGGHNHVGNGLPAVPGVTPRRTLQPGGFMPEVVDKETGFREVGTALAQSFWKEYMASQRNCENLGMAYLITGDEKYAKKGIELMKLYARQYAELDWATGFFDPPWNSGPNILCSSRISANSTYGSNWQMKWHCKMLAMIAESPSWTPEQRAAVYAGFVLPYATEIMKYFPATLSNQTDITNHNLLLLGLVFDDANMVRWATRTDTGLISRLRDINDDGFSSEGRPLNYHFASMEEYLPALTYLENSGLKIDYPRQKLLAAMRMPYQRAALTGRIPNSGDCARGFTVGNNALADHLLTLFPNEQWLSDIGGSSALSKKVRLYASAQKPDPDAAKKLFETKPRLFADAGVAVLRAGGTIGTQIMATLDYGRNPFHAALDRNQFTLLAFGRTFTHGPGSLYNVGSGGITRGTEKRLDSFCSHGSLGQNIILVDAKDQRISIGRLLAWKPDEDLQVAISRVDGIQPGVSHTRGVALTQGVVILLDRVESEQEHVYDFAYHNFGKMALGEGWTAAAMDKPLATTANYENIMDLRKLTGSGVLRVTWDLTDQVPDRDKLKESPPKIALGFWQLPVEGGEIYTGVTGMNNPNTATIPDAAPSVFHRVRAKTARFVTVLEPNQGISRVKTIESVPGQGARITFSDGKSVVVSLDDLLKQAKSKM